MNTLSRTARLIAGLVAAGQAAAQVTIYENEGFAGRSFTTQRAVGNFDRYGFDNRASSVMVASGRWEVCEDPGFSGQEHHVQMTAPPGNTVTVNRFGEPRG